MKLRCASAFFSQNSDFIRVAWRAGWSHYLNTHAPSDVVSAFEMAGAASDNKPRLYADFCENHLAPALHILNGAHSPNPAFKTLEASAKEREILAAFFLAGNAIAKMPEGQKQRVFGNVLPELVREVSDIEQPDEWLYLDLSPLAAKIMRLDEAWARNSSEGQWLAGRAAREAQVVYSAKLAAPLQALMNRAKRPSVFN